MLITGAAGGLGKATAEAFLEAGAKVSICDVNKDRLAQTTTEISSTYSDKFLATLTDVTDEAAVNELFNKTIEKFGRLDIMVNNAGVADK